MDKQKNKLQIIQDYINNNTVAVVLIISFSLISQIKNISENIEYSLIFFKTLFSADEIQEFDLEKNTLNILLLNFERLEKDLNSELKLEEAINNRFKDLIENKLELQFIYDKNLKPKSFDEAVDYAIQKNAKLVIFGNYFEKSNQVEIKYAYITKEISFILFNDSVVNFEGTNLPGDSIITFVYKNSTGIINLDKLSYISDIKNPNILREIDYIVYSFLAFKKYEELNYDDCVKIAELIPLGFNINDLGAIDILFLCLEKSQNLKKLLEICNKIIIAKPESYEAYLRRAECYFKLKQYINSIKDCNTALKLNPNSSRVHTLKGNILMKFSDMANAIENFNKAISIDSLNISAIENRGICFINIKKYQLAMNDFNKVISLNPYESSVYMNRGVCYKRQYQYDKALKDYNKAIELNKEEHLTYYNRAIIYYNNLKCYDSAISDLNFVISKDSSYLNAYLYRYYCYIELQNFDKQLENLNIILKLDTNNSEYYTTRGYVLIKLNQYELAINDFNIAIIKNSKNAYAYNNRGWAYSNLGLYEEALKDFNISYILDKNNNYLYIFRGLTYYKMKKYKESMSDLLKVYMKNKEYQQEIKETIHKIKSESKLK